MSIKGDNNVLDVAKYIIHYCHTNNIYITNLKLQKLLYFCEAIYLLEFRGKRACFNESIVAWQYGPVVKEAYFEYSLYGSSEIKDVSSSETRLESKLHNVSIIKDVLDSLAKLDAFELVDITHSQNPWINAYGTYNGAPISKKSIYDFFKKNN